jgi:hypothetical protein
MNRAERRSKGNRRRNDIIKNYRKFLDTIDDIHTYQCEDCGSTFGIIKFKDGRLRATCSSAEIPCEKCKEMMANGDYGQGINKPSETAGD